MITPLTGHVTTAAANRFACTAHAVEYRDDARDALTDGDAAPPRDALTDGDAAAAPRDALTDGDAAAPRDALTDVDARRDTDGDTDGETTLHCA